MSKFSKYLADTAAEVAREVPTSPVRDTFIPLPAFNRNSEVAKKELGEIKAILRHSAPGFIAGSFQHIGGRGDIDPKDWARVLRVREEAGEHLSIIQRQAWREALGVTNGD